VEEFLCLYRNKTFTFLDYLLSKIPPFWNILISEFKHALTYLFKNTTDFCKLNNLIIIMAYFQLQNHEQKYSYKYTLVNLSFMARELSTRSPQLNFMFQVWAPSGKSFESLNVPRIPIAGSREIISQSSDVL